MQLPSSKDTTGEWGGFKQVRSGGYVLGLMIAEEGTTSAQSKNPGEDKLVLSFDIIEGENKFHFKEWGERKNANRFMKLHLPVSGMAKIVYTLKHLGKETGGAQENYINAALANEDIDIEKLTAGHYKTGGILKYSDSGFLEIDSLVSVAEARKIGPSDELPPTPQKASGGSNSGAPASFTSDPFGSNAIGF